MIDLRFYWSLLLRRLPVMLALLLVCTVLGVVTAIRAPATYSTSARLLVEGPQIAAEMANTNPGAAETLQVIEQQLLTRANMIDIANKFRVFGDAQMTPDEKVQRMREGTSIRRAAGRDQAAMMTVAFTGDRPAVVADVVNEYVTLILSGSTRNRVGRAEEQLRFYQQEVERLSADLDAQNARILQFKRENAAALPENLQYRLGRQTLLQERVARLQADITALQTQRTDMMRIFEQTGSVAGLAQSPEQQQLTRLKSRLTQLEAISQTDDNPRIRALRTQIAALEENLQDTAPEAAASQTGNPLLDLNLSQIDSRIEAAQAEIDQAGTELEELEGSIRETSANSLALAALERDQANIQSRYNAAVASLAQARTVERIESSSRGERITVIESASTPSMPSGPNRKKIAAMGAGAGLGLAVGFFVLMELLNGAIRRPAELRARFQLTPLAVIPYIETRHERSKRVALRLGLIVAVVTMIPLGLWYLHMNYMPLDILTMKIIERLGLG